MAQSLDLGDVLLAFLVAPLAFAGGPSAKLSTPSDCLGPSRAESFLVYLHGRDSEPPGALEMSNRKTLQRIADALQMRIALPRGNEICRGKGPPHCWGWETSEAQASRAILQAQKAADFCFGPGKTYGLVGFSNGGYIVGHIFRSCLKRPDGKSFPWLISVGSAAANPPHSEWVEDLSQCGSYALITGNQDLPNQDRDERFQKAIVARKGRIKALKFDGGHEVPYEPTHSVISAETSGPTIAVSRKAPGPLQRSQAP